MWGPGSGHTGRGGGGGGGGGGWGGSGGGRATLKIKGFLLENRYLGRVKQRPHTFDLRKSRCQECLGAFPWVRTWPLEQKPVWPTYAQELGGQDPALGLESPRRGPGMYGGGAGEADVWGFILLKQQSCAVFLWAGRIGEPSLTRSFQTN